MAQREAADHDALEDEDADAAGRIRAGLHIGAPSAATHTFGAGHKGLAGLLEPFAGKIRAQVRICVEHTHPLGNRLTQMRKSHVALPDLPVEGTRQTRQRTRSLDEADGSSPDTLGYTADMPAADVRADGLYALLYDTLRTHGHRPALHVLGDGSGHGRAWLNAAGFGALGHSIEHAVRLYVQAGASLAADPALRDALRHLDDMIVAMR